MSLKHEVTFYCDACETQFLVDEDIMELPPAWLGMQVVIADTEGCIPEHEREVYCHFCSQECLIEYSSSKYMRERLLLADKSIKDPFEEDSEQE